MLYNSASVRHDLRHRFSTYVGFVRKPGHERLVPFIFYDTGAAQVIHSKQWMLPAGRFVLRTIWREEWRISKGCYERGYVGRRWHIQDENRLEMAINIYAQLLSDERLTCGLSLGPTQSSGLTVR